MSTATRWGTSTSSTISSEAPTRLRIQGETPDGDVLNGASSFEALDTNGDGRINGSDSFSSITTINGKTGLLLLTDWAFGWFSEDPTFLAGITQLTVSDIVP